jgi:hypothetical protein
MTYRWPISKWENHQCHFLPESYKLKPQWGTDSGIANAKMRMNIEENVNQLDLCIILPQIR